jgi:hypothetical protein
VYANGRLMINDDIEAIIQHGKERTVELNNKYEGLNFEDLTNFKSYTLRFSLFLYLLLPIVNGPSSRLKMANVCWRPSPETRCCCRYPCSHRPCPTTARKHLIWDRYLSSPDSALYGVCMFECAFIHIIYSVHVPISTYSEELHAKIPVLPLIKG